MPKPFRPQARAAIVGIGLLALVLNGCGWFSRTKAAPPAAPAPAAAQTSASSPTPVPPPAVPRRPPDGRIATEEILRSLVQGKTTRAEVREAFGAPQEVIVGPATETFLYYRERTSGFISRTTQRVETLTLRFDLKGVLKDFEYRSTGK